MAETSGALTAQAHINAYGDARSRAYDADPGHGVLSEGGRRAWLDALRELLPPAQPILYMPCSII